MKYPVWECRKHDGNYQISAIFRDGDDSYRSCQWISELTLDAAWYPELIIISAIIETNNDLYSMIEGEK